MKPRPLGSLTYIFAAVWIANGLFCKILGFVPRHEHIVARILGPEYAPQLTVTIGVLEVMMAAWILSGIRRRWSTLAQAIVVATMNVLEFLIAPDLLLFGRMNIVVAAVFITVLLMYERRMQTVAIQNA
jgi:hypothetical protein